MTKSNDTRARQLDSVRGRNHPVSRTEICAAGGDLGSQGPQKKGHTHSIPLLPWPRLPQSECLPHRAEQSDSAWSLRLRTDGIFCPRIPAGGCGLDGAVRHHQQSEWRSSRRQRSLLYSHRDMWPVLAKKLPGSAVGGKASEDRPVKGTVHILVFFLAGSQSSRARMVLVAGWCGEELGVEQICSADFEFLGNLHNLPGFQKPVGKEVVVTEGREAKVIEGTAPSLYAHVDCPSSTGPRPPERSDQGSTSPLHCTVRHLP